MLERSTAPKIGLLAVATVVLWIVPSIGTQGMGTTAARVAHPDAALFDKAAATRDVARLQLAEADHAVEVSLGE